MSEYVIATNTPSRIVVETGSSIFQLDTLIFFALIIAFAVLVMRVKTNPPIRYTFRVAAACVAPVLLAITALFSHTMSIDRERNLIGYEDYWAGIPYYTFTAPLRSLNEVEIETDGPSRRITLVFSDRANEYPLGFSFRSGDNAYYIRDSINGFLKRQ